MAGLMFLSTIGVLVAAVLWIVWDRHVAAHVARRFGWSGWWRITERSVDSFVGLGHAVVVRQEYAASMDGDCVCFSAYYAGLGACGTPPSGSIDASVVVLR
jgi:hypothetical protein